MISADSLAVSHEVTSAAIDIALISHMAKDVPLNSHKVKARGQGDGKGLLVVGSEDLDAKRHLGTHGLADLHADHGHRSDHLGPGDADVRDVVHVLHHYGVDAATLVKKSLLDSLLCDLGKRLFGKGSAGESLDVYHSDNTVVEESFHVFRVDLDVCYAELICYKVGDKKNNNKST